MNKDIRDEILRTTILTNAMLEELKEMTTYRSIGTLNMVVDLLQAIRHRIERGDIIKYEKTGKNLTIKSFEDVLNENFLVYITREVFKTTKSKDVFFNLDNTESGLDLIYSAENENKLFKWIANIENDYALVYLRFNKVVYIQNRKTKDVELLKSEHNSCYIYDEVDSKIKEVFDK